MCYSQRSAVFKWIAGIVATIPIEELNALLFNLMSPLVREMSTTEESNAPLRQLAKEVASMIKKQIGIEEYARLLNKVQQKLDSKKTERRKIRKQQVKQSGKKFLSGLSNALIPLYLMPL